MILVGRSARTFACLAALLSILLLPVLTCHAAPLVLTAAGGRVSLSGHLQLLKDATGRLRIEEVAQPPCAGRFQELAGPLAAGFFQHGAVWLRFTIQRGPDAPKLWFLRVDPPDNEQLQLYLPGPGAYQVKYGGSLRPFSQREVPYRTDLFRIPLPSEGPQTFYLRIASQRSLMAHLTLWQPDTLRGASTREALVHGAYLGILLLTLCLTLLYWIQLRVRLYGYYFCYVFSVAYLFLDNFGYAHQFLWSERTWIQPPAIRLALLLFLVTNAGLLSQILDLPKRMPRFDRCFRTACFGIGGAGLLMVLAGYHDLIIIPLQITILVAACLSVAVSLRLLRRAPGAGLYLVAFGILLLFGGMRVLANFGLLPETELLGSVRISASLCHVMALNIAIVSRMITARQEMNSIAAALAAERWTVDQQYLFLRLISHELRTPLAIIDSAAQVLPLLREDRQKFDQKAGSILVATKRMQEMLERYLGVERLCSEGMVPGIREVDIREVVGGLAGRIQGETPRHRIQFSPERLPESFACDPDLVEVLIGNLLENAVKYSPEGGEITLCGWAGGRGDLFLEVRDRGVGIPPGQLDRIFDRYYRAGQLPGVTGAGLGLYLAQKIAQLHGGEVVCQSEPGRGSIFTVRLQGSAG